MSVLIKLFKKYNSVGLVGNSNSGKSSFVLGELLKIKKEINIPVYVLGSEVCLHSYLQSKNLKILHSADDVLDMKITNSVIYIDEFSDLFDVNIASKQTDKIKMFFNRISHLNNFVVISSAQVNFWNKFMCSLVRAFIVKKIEYTHLVRGTDLKRKIMNISDNCSSYRLDIVSRVYYVITDDDCVIKGSFEYDVLLDSKKDLVNPFIPNPELNAELSFDFNRDK